MCGYIGGGTQYYGLESDSYQAVLNVTWIGNVNEFVHFHDPNTYVCKYLYIPYRLCIYCDGITLLR
jgi:hypothetical protein